MREGGDGSASARTPRVLVPAINFSSRNSNALIGDPAGESLLRIQLRLSRNSNTSPADAANNRSEDADASAVMFGGASETRVQFAP